MNNEFSTPAEPVAAPKPETNRPAQVYLKLRKILVPVDFSIQSKKALMYALAFARQFGAKVILLHVVDIVVYPADLGYGPIILPETNETMQHSAKNRLESLVRDEVQGIFAAATLVRLGSAYHEICAAAKDEEVDLIIIATHGHTGLKHVVLGSTAERVVRHAPCPVLTVREHEHEFV